MKPHLALLAALLSLGLSGPALAGDLTLVFATRVNGQSGTATEYMTRDKLRMNEGDHDSILDTGKGQVTMIDHGKKEYAVMTLAEMETAMHGAAEKMSANQDKMAEAMKNMPPEMRERMQTMMGGSGGPMAHMKVTEVADGRKIAGYDTTAYLMSMGDAMETRLWTTTAITPPLEPGEILRLQSIANPMMKNMGAAMDEFRKVKGLTLATHSRFSMMGHTQESSREVTTIKQDPLPASVFAVPAGYRQVESAMARMNADKH